VRTRGAGQLVWYAAYGSNLRRERFLCYLSGGQPEGSARTYAGCRDPAGPRAESALRFPGGLAFGGESGVWTGGMAFLDRQAAGEVAARTYLVTLGQFSDVVAQEIRQEPGRDIAADLVLTGGVHGLGRGRYDCVVNLGQQDGFPVLTITAAALPLPAPPAEAYLRSMVLGLTETFGLAPDEIADYLTPARGLDGVWNRARLLALAAGAAA